MYPSAKPIKPLRPELEADFESLKDLLGLPGDLELPSDPVLAHRRPPEMDGTLSDTAVANLRAWYADDVEFYERCLEFRAKKFNKIPSGV